MPLVFEPPYASKSRGVGGHPTQPPVVGCSASFYGVIIMLTPFMRSAVMCLILGVLSSVSVNAAIIDFDAFPSGTYAYPGDSIGTEDGYSLVAHSSGTVELGIHSFFSTTGNGVSQGNPGTPVLQVTRASTFTFDSFDTRDQSGSPAEPITVTGFLLGVPQGSDVFDPNPGPAMTTMPSINLAGIAIDELRISFPVPFPAFNFVNFDNIVLSDVAVPEPSTLTLLGFAAIGLGMRSRRRRKAA
jgi:hypothetical protein